MRWLKRIRVVVAIVFFLAITVLFLDINNVIPEGVRSFFGATQAAPSFIRMLAVFSFASAGIIIILLSTILFGRIYCSTLCPLGTLQDVIIRISKRMNRRRRFKYEKPRYVLHYSIFAAAVIIALLGSMILIDLLEPFSNYGRILSNLAAPVVATANNGINYIFSLIGYDILYQVPILNINFISVLAALSMMILVGYLSYRHGRLFCNLLCPVGAFLGLLSRFSLFKIVIDKNNCKECGLCERVCKSSCIKSGAMEIDFAACVGCFNCIDSCPTIGMSYQQRWKKEPDPVKEADPGRREILKSSILPALGLLLPVISQNDSILKNEKRSGNNKQPISPPGSISVERFSSLCTACHLCVSSCPTQVLFPSFLEYGITGVFQPRMNYDISYCNYDCTYCGEICPTGAILPLSPSSKQEVQIGKVQFVKNDCIVVVKKQDCGACSEHCPTKAVHMVPYEQNLMVPETSIDICVGCGACEHVCPAEPRKAIIVNSNLVHQKALKPAAKKQDKVFDSTQDFPF